MEEKNSTFAHEKDSIGRGEWDRKWTRGLGWGFKFGFERSVRLQGGRRGACRFAVGMV